MPEAPPRCSSCRAPGQRAQAAGERCRRRDGSGDPCAGLLVIPFSLRCVACAAEVVGATSTPSDPSMVLPCPRCGGRLATI